MKWLIWVFQSSFLVWLSNEDTVYISHKIYVETIRKKLVKL